MDDENVYDSFNKVVEEVNIVNEIEIIEYFVVLVVFECGILK